MYLQELNDKKLRNKKRLTLCQNIGIIKMLTICQNKKTSYKRRKEAARIGEGENRMPKGSKELTEARKEEIIAACAELYKTMSFKDITIKEIGNVTSFTRTSIYNYFRTKEEIFLALLQREYELWIDSLKQIQTEHERMNVAAFADALARSLEERKNLLKIMSMNHYDMEENSCIERLIDFKVVYGQSLAEVRNCLDKFFTEMTPQDKQDFIYSFFPFMFGIYPYTVVTEKQKKAMKQAGVNYVYMSIYEMTYAEVKKLLSNVS